MKVRARFSCVAAVAILSVMPVSAQQRAERRSRR